MNKEKEIKTDELSAVVGGTVQRSIQKCPLCNGSGSVRKFFFLNTVCSKCNGSGEIEIAVAMK